MTKPAWVGLDLVICFHEYILITLSDNSWLFAMPNFVPPKVPGTDAAQRTVILFLVVASISIWQVSLGLGARLSRRRLGGFVENCEHLDVSGPLEDPKRWFPLCEMEVVFPRCSAVLGGPSAC